MQAYEALYYCWKFNQTACKETVKIMFGKYAVSEVSKIPPSNSTISRRIQEMAKEIENSMESKVTKHKLFAL